MRTSVMLACAVMATSPSAFAQGATYAVLTPTDADAILNGVFSKPPVDSSLGQFHIVLRYLPSFKPEEQIAVSYKGPDSPSAVAYETLKTPLRQVLGESDDRTTLARRAGLSAASAAVTPDKVRVWLQGLTNSAAASLPAIRGEVMPNDKGHGIDIHVDGTNYLMSLHSLENQVSFNVVGPELGSGAHDLPII
jgi:hypothetical protein